MENKNFIDSFVDLVRKFRGASLLIKLYDSYKEVILYLFFGALTTLVNIITYIVFTNAFKVEYLIGNVIAWIVSVVFAYSTNKIYVFESKECSLKILLKEISSFFFERIMSLGLDMGIMYVGCSILSINDLLMKIVSNTFVIILNYVFSKYIIFNNKNI